MSSCLPHRLVKVLAYKVSSSNQFSRLCGKYDHNQASITNNVRVQLIVESLVEYVVVHTCDDAPLVIAALVVSYVEQEGWTS